MIDSQRVVAFLPVKGESQRVANKNVRTFNGEPFFLFTLRKLLRCSQIDEVFVDSESEAILQLAARRRRQHVAPPCRDGVQRH